MKNLFRLLVITLGLGITAYAQLPPTCVYVVGTAPYNITMTAGTQTFVGLCVQGTVYQVFPYGSAPNTLGLSSRPVCHARYSFAADGGAISTIIPVSGCTIPAGAFITNEVIFVSTACTSSGSGTMAVGITGTTNALMTATAVGSMGANTVIQGSVVPQTASGFLHVTSPVNVTFTVATATYTAGIVDVWVDYIQGTL